MSNRPTPLLPVVAVVMAMTAGCAIIEDSGKFGFAGLQPCSVMPDCDPGKVCAMMFGFCFDPLPAGTPLTFTVIPVDQTDAVMEQYNAIPTPNPGRIDVTIAPATLVSGRILPPDGESDGAYTGDGVVVAHSPGRVPGLAFRHQALATSGPDGPSFTMAVAPDLDYVVTFVPADASLPPVSWNLAPGISGTVDLKVNTGLFELVGVILTQNDTRTVPLAGAVVQATAGERRSSSSVTDDNGIFRVRIPETSERITIQVLPGQSGAIFPTRTMLYDGIDALKAALPASSFMSIDLGTLPGTASITFQVLSVFMDGRRIPMGGTRIFIEKLYDTGPLEQRVAVDGNGFATALLPSGKYLASALPPGTGPTTDLASSSFSKQAGVIEFLPGENRIFGFQLPSRPRVSGRVVSAAGDAPIEGAHVVLATDTSGLVDWSMSITSDLVFEAVTDRFGEFDVPVEPGSYSLLVVPPANSAAAPASWPALTLTGTENLRIGLGGRCLLAGRTIDSDGQPVGAAQLTFFQSISDTAWEGWAQRQSPLSSSIRETGNARTTVDGRFEVLLPCPDQPATLSGCLYQSWNDPVLIVQEPSPASR